jgi:hypothetical protein
MSAPDNCHDCAFHKVVRDPEPDDWFNTDDEATLCTKTGPSGSKSQYGHEFPHRAITSADRPYQSRKYSTRPGWCPLMQDDASPLD